MIKQLMEMLKGKRNVDEYARFESLVNVKRISEDEAIFKIDGLSSEAFRVQNALLLGDSNIVYMIPHNDGTPACPFVWYQKNDKYLDITITNQDDFTEIKNLPKILDNISDIMIESYERKQPIVPFNNFGIELTDKIQPGYTGNGKLVLITGDFLNSKAKAESEKASIYFANEFLDKFIGWNYGDIVREEVGLEEKLMYFNLRLIDDGTRSKDHPTGFEVCSRGEIDCFYRFPRY